MSDRLTNILLIDDDPVFRLGLHNALEPFPDLQIVAEAETAEAALEILESQGGEEPINLVVLELLLESTSPDGLSKIPLCEHLKADYPEQPILLLTAQSEIPILMDAKECGVEGYCPKGSSVGIIVEAMRQVASGQSYWQTLPLLQKAARIPSWQHQLRSYGLRQIEQALSQIGKQLNNPDLSDWDWLYWNGRRRELVAARWVVNQLLPTEVFVVEESSEEELPKIRSRPRRQMPRLSEASTTRTPQQQPRDTTAIAPLPTSPLGRIPEQSTLFEVTVTKLQSGLANRTGIVLEIDILQADKKRDLLYIILRKYEDILDELGYSQVERDQLFEMRSQILLDLWQASLTDFFGKYYTLAVDNRDLEIVKVLQAYAVTVQASILDKIPFVPELLSQQLYETPLIVDNVSYPALTPEAMARAEVLLQNLIIQVANAVIQPLLNEFADVEIIKLNFFNRNLLSSRELARFRNNLSWQYRYWQLVAEPRAIFESRYELLILTSTGMKRISIYMPRRQELEELRGIRLAVTLLYELRDATAPRLRGVLGWLGGGAVYVLTQVIGKGIGLVIRGVIQGIGTSLQDLRFGKDSDRSK